MVLIVNSHKFKCVSAGGRVVLQCSMQVYDKVAHGVKEIITETGNMSVEKYTLRLYEHYSMQVVLFMCLSCRCTEGSWLKQYEHASACHAL